MKKVTFIMALMLLPLTTSIGMVQAQTDTPPHDRAHVRQSDPSGSEWMPPWMHHLPKEKQDAFMNIHQTRTKTIYPLVMQFKAKQAQLMAELAQENVNRKNVDQTLTQMNDLNSRIAREQLELLLEIRNQFPEALMHGMLMGPGMGMRGPGMGMGMLGGTHGMGGGMGSGMMGGGTGCPMMGGKTGGGMMGGHH